MAERVLTRRELNRTTLARQLLLSRSSGTADEVISRLFGLQAQAAMAPFVGIWTRAEGIRREDIAAGINNRKLLKATMMRGTLHLVTAEDYVQFRSTLQPVLDAALDSILKGRVEGLDVPRLLEAARPFFQEAPRSFAQFTKFATALMPGTDAGAMRYTARTQLPLVQVPVSRGWSYPGNPQFTLAESWLNRPIPSKDRFKELVLRYLAAFGPASITDMQAWSGFGQLKDRIDSMRSDLRVYRDENRRELFDLPDRSIEDPDRPAPERFLPEFDNVLLSYSNRTRIIAGEHRRHVFVPGLRVRPTFLVDGFVAGTWRFEKAKGTASVTIEPFGALSTNIRQALLEEAEQLVRFAGHDSKNHEVRFGS